jgi:hypothetical protein
MSENTTTKELDFKTVILILLGVIVVVYVINKMYKEYRSVTDSSVISDKALANLNDPEKAKLLDKEVEKYHKTGKWDMEGLKLAQK